VRGERDIKGEERGRKRERREGEKGRGEREEKGEDSSLEKVQMFQPIIAGSEVGRGYSELNDPIDQKERFEEQGRLLEAGDEEAMMPDLEFVEMLEHGMPPTCGFGFGERLFAILTGKTLRELQTFPLMRPKE
jgi:lysyl-tRNA synthetase class 2